MSSSHPPFTAEAVYDVRLLLFWPAARLRYKIRFATRGFQVMPFTAKPSGCPFFPPYGGLSGTKCHSGSSARFPKEAASVSDNHWPKPFIFWYPVTQSLKERFRTSVIFWTSGARSPLVQTSALMLRRPGGLNEADFDSFKYPFPSPHHSSSLLSLTW